MLAVKRELIHLGLYLVFSAIALPVHGQSVVPGEMIVKFEKQPTQPQLLEIERSIGVDIDWRPCATLPMQKESPLYRIL